jgi:hypothetical protein
MTYKNPDIVPKKPNANTRLTPEYARRSVIGAKILICVIIGMKLALFWRATMKITKDRYLGQTRLWRNVAKVGEKAQRPVVLVWDRRASLRAW